MAPSDAPSHPLSPPWGRFRLKAEEPLDLEIGPQFIRLLFTEGEVRLAGEPAATGALGSWSRWAVPGGEANRAEVQVHVRPALPDRPLLVQPEVPFSLLPLAEARIFIRVPLTIRLEIDLEPQSTRPPVLFRSIPSVGLSDTWWGEPDHGELCWWLETTARRRVDASLLTPHLAICPLHMTNQSRADLRVEKLCFRMKHLSLFSDGIGFWADTARVRYQGENEGSRINMTGTAPDEATSPRLVAAPQVTTQGFTARTFARLRAFHPLGFGGPP
jgi:hypothetical protein